MANRPSLYTFLDRLLTNVIADFQADPLNLTGLQAGQVIKSNVHNSLQLVNGLWQAYLDSKTTRTGDELATSVDQRWSADKLEYPLATSITVGLGAAPTTQPVYYFDGYRVEMDEALLSPNGADPLLRPFVPLPGRVWIYLDVSVINDPFQPFATIVIEDVGPGIAASPAAGQLALVGLDISVTGDITANVYPGAEPDFEIVFGTLARRYIGKTRFEDVATLENIGSVAAIVNGQLDINGAAITGLTVDNASAADASATFTNTLGTGATCSGNHATKGALEAVNGGAGPSILATKTVAGVGVRADTTVGGGTAVEALGGAIGLLASSSAGSAVDATTATGSAVRATATSNGPAVNAIGGPNPASRAVTALSGDVGAIVILATTAANALTTAVAVQGTANGAAIGVRGLAGEGYGVVAQSDTSSPDRAALRMVPQDADPTTFLQGDVYFNDNRAGSGIPRIYTTTWASLHASPKGRVFAFGLSVAGGPIGGGSGNQSLVQVSPEEVGDVLVESTGSLDFSVDTGTCTVAIWDITAVVQVAIQIERAIDTDLAGGNVRSFVIRSNYTLPDTATRTFATVIQVNAGTITYANLVTTAQGVQ